MGKEYLHPNKLSNTEVKEVYVLRSSNAYSGISSIYFVVVLEDGKMLFIYHYTSTVYIKAPVNVEDEHFSRLPYPTTAAKSIFTSDHPLMLGLPVFDSAEFNPREEEEVETTIQMITLLPGIFDINKLRINLLYITLEYSIIEHESFD